MKSHTNFIVIVHKFNSGDLYNLPTYLHVAQYFDILRKMTLKNIRFMV